MKALLFERSLPRFAAARVAPGVAPGAGRGSDRCACPTSTSPTCPAPTGNASGPGWPGSAAATWPRVDGRSSRYFEPIVASPSSPATRSSATSTTGRRVVLEPVLRCVARGIDAALPGLRGRATNRCDHIAFGHLEPGLQTGFYCDTGGGWGIALVAHPSQLHPVPEDMSDEAAVMVEPTACAVHGALAASAADGDTVAVIGAGTLGL